MKQSEAQWATQLLKTMHTHSRSITNIRKHQETRLSWQGACCKADPARLGWVILAWGQSWLEGWSQLLQIASIAKAWLNSSFCQQAGKIWKRAEAGTDWQRMIYPGCNLKILNGTWWHCKSCTACSILWIIAIQTQLCKELTALILRHETNADFDTLQLCSNDVQIYASDLGQVFTCLICSLGSLARGRDSGFLDAHWLPIPRNYSCIFDSVTKHNTPPIDMVSWWEIDSEIDTMTF